MIKVDNSQIIERIFPVLEPGQFVNVYIQQRKKDGNVIDKLRRTYFIRSLEELRQTFPEMVTLARMYNARVYININPKSMDKLFHGTLEELFRLKMENCPVKNPMDVTISVAGKLHTAHKPAKWIIDIDRGDEWDIAEIANVLRSQSDGAVVEIPTVSGRHFVVDAFNTRYIEEAFPGLYEKIKKDSMGTLLYYEG